MEHPLVADGYYCSCDPFADPYKDMAADFQPTSEQLASGRYFFARCLNFNTLQVATHMHSCYMPPAIAIAYPIPHVCDVVAVAGPLVLQEGEEGLCTMPSHSQTRGAEAAREGAKGQRRYVGACITSGRRQPASRTRACTHAPACTHTSARARARALARGGVCIDFLTRVASAMSVDHPMYTCGRSCSERERERERERESNTHWSE